MEREKRVLYFFSKKKEHIILLAERIVLYFFPKKRVNVFVGPEKKKY